MEEGGDCGKIAEQKRKCRKIMRGMLSDFCKSDGGVLRSEYSVAAAAAFLDSNLYSGADEIFAYMPMPCELDVLEIVRRGLFDGRRVAVPRLCADGGGGADGIRMEFLYVPPEPGWEAGLSCGALGILEPPVRWEAADLGSAARTVVLVPGLAFSEGGARLGRGKGFYDRFLSSALGRGFRGGRSAAFCGVGFSFQCLPCVPSERHDVRMDFLLTERGLARCAASARG